MDSCGCWGYLNQGRRADGNGVGGSSWGDGGDLRGTARLENGDGRGFPDDPEPFYTMNGSVVCIRHRVDFDHSEKYGKIAHLAP